MFINDGIWYGRNWDTNTLYYLIYYWQEMFDNGIKSKQKSQLIEECNIKMRLCEYVRDQMKISFLIDLSRVYINVRYELAVFHKIKICVMDYSGKNIFL